MDHRPNKRPSDLFIYNPAKRCSPKFSKADRERLRLWKITWEANQDKIIKNFNNHQYELALISTPRDNYTLGQHQQKVFTAYVQIKAIEHFYKHVVLLDLIEATHPIKQEFPNLIVTGIPNN